MKKFHNIPLSCFFFSGKYTYSWLYRRKLCLLYHLPILYSIQFTHCFLRVDSVWQISLFYRSKIKYRIVFFSRGTSHTHTQLSILEDYTVNCTKYANDKLCQNVSKYTILLTFFLCRKLFSPHYFWTLPNRTVSIQRAWWVCPTLGAHH